MKKSNLIPKQKYICRRTVDGKHNGVYTDYTSRRDFLSRRKSGEAYE